MAKKENTVDAARRIAKPVLDELGLTLWSVTYEKEGTLWYLRYYIDKEGGVSIDDCEAFSRAVEKRLDAEDPIDGSYTLEVSSPGVERELTEPWHFEAMLGETVALRLIRPVEGVRDFVGTLKAYEAGVLTLALDEETEMEVDRKETAFIRLYNDFSGGTGK